MIGEPEVRIGAGDAAIWVTAFVLVGMIIGWLGRGWTR